MASKGERMFMLNFSLSKIGAAPHGLVRKIDLQKETLQFLILNYQNKINQEIKKLEDWKSIKLNDIQKKNQGEPKEVIQHKEEPIHLEYDFRMEDILSMKNLFFHATFILAYSYFESIVSAMCKEKNIKVKNQIDQNIKCILCITKTSLPADIEKKRKYVVENLRNIRNLLTHNYNGTGKEEQLKTAVKETKKKIGFKMITDDVYIVESQYVRQALDCEYTILQELSSVLRL